MNEFSIGECVRFGWDTFKKRAWFFVGVTLVIVLISGVASQMTSLPENVQTMQGGVMVAAIAALVIGIVAGICIKMGTIVFLLKAHDNVESAQISDLWAPHPFWKYVITGIATGVIVLVGLILLIVPGIIWALRFMFASYIVMDKGMNAQGALKESWRMTKGSTWKLLGLVLVIAGLNIVGALCLIVGLLVSIPVSSLAFIRAYRTLQKKAGDTPVAA